MEEIKTIDEYILQFPLSVQKDLNELRNLIKELAYDATEVISWGMPTFKLNGNLIHFAAYKKHIGIYPGPDAIIEFKNELKDYVTSKGAIQFIIGKPLPVELIKKIVIHRLAANRR